LLTQERLKELLSYDPETGLFTWLVTRGGAQAGKVVTHKEGSGYIQFTIDGKNYRACRLAFLYMTGEWPKAHVDHIDRDVANDRWLNLRDATRSQNKANSGVYSNNFLGVKGVNKPSIGKKYRARIQVDSKPKHLGYFDTPELARAAYLDAAKQYYGEFAA
jgi:hypothetical protein